MNEALTQNPISDVPERALLVVQILVWPRRFWTDAPQSSFWTQRRLTIAATADEHADGCQDCEQEIEHGSTLVTDVMLE